MGVDVRKEVENMKIQDLQTPAILLRAEAFNNNIKKYQQACNEHGKQLWPMVKTHKSTDVALMQQRVGASGFLCGTFDECEALCARGIKNLMYAYPVAGEVSCRRAVELAKKCNFYVRVDSISAASQLDKIAREAGVTIKYTIILDCGLHRFGMPAEKILPFAEGMKQFTNLEFQGISTHCGHVYGEADADKVPMYVEQESAAIHKAVDDLKESGFDVKMVTSGSTPTFWGSLSDDYVQIYHPGNYVFHDRIQMANRTATEDECALVVYATVISHPREDLIICDAGAKCLGLDQGAHGNSAVQGYGSVIGHPELLVTSLSEEVGKIQITGTTDVKVGDRIMIIPNHSCSSANLTDYYIVVDKDDNVVTKVPVDIRGNSTDKNMSAEVKTEVQTEAADSKGIRWPFWLNLAVAALLPFFFWWANTPTNLLHQDMFGPLLEMAGAFSMFIHFTLGIPAGIVGLVKAKKMKKFRIITRILSIINLLVAALGIGMILVIFVGALTGDIRV